MDGGDKVGFGGQDKDNDLHWITAVEGGFPFCVQVGLVRGAAWNGGRDCGEFHNMAWVRRAPGHRREIR